MYSSTRGIVFRLTKYSDTSLIVRIFTEEFGLRSYLVRGARRPKSKLKASFFQPLTLLEMVVPERGKSELHHIREARAAYIYHSIPTDISKSSILIFLNELLYKSIREETAHPEVFRYIFDQMVYLDGVDHLPACFHLLFALQLTRFLGFFPQLKPDRPTDVFDLQEGQFTRPGEMNPQYIISGPECSTFAKLLTLEPQEHPDFIIPAPVRNSLLEKILLYYTLHLPITGEFKSHLVLHEVLKK